MLLATLSPADWSPVLMAVSAAVSASAAYGGHRVAKRQHKPQIEKLVADTTKTITEAAQQAVGLVEGRLKDATAQLTTAQAQITDLQVTLEATRKELREATEARSELLAQIGRRDVRIEHLEAEVARLEAALDELAARVGGRRAEDAA